MNDTVLAAVVVSLPATITAIGGLLVVLQRQQKVVEKLDAQNITAVEVRDEQKAANTEQLDAVKEMATLGSEHAATLAVIKTDVNANYTAMLTKLDERDVEIAQRDEKIAELLTAGRTAQDTALAEALVEIRELKLRLENQTNGGPGATQRT